MLLPKMKTFRALSWNVNGLRAALNKGLDSVIDDPSLDAVCLQETKIDPQALEKLEFQSPYPYCHWHSAERKGYSGTAILSRRKPIAVSSDFPAAKKSHPPEGRMIAAEFEAFFLVNTYVPNARRDLSRLDYRSQHWDPDLRRYLTTLANTKPVIVCGDFNVAHREIDLANPKSNRRNAGFTDEERNGFSQLLEAGFVDIFRARNPDTPGLYTWWTWRANARQRNIGWRIDYFLVSESIANAVHSAEIHPEIHGSDHCPISIEW